MKKFFFRTLSLLVSLLFINNLALLANPITVDQAKQNALSMLLSSDGPRRVSGNVKLKLAHSLNLPVNGVVSNNPQVYAFNVGDNDGFVIVSGDDVAESVLGYSEEGSFIADSIPENMREWLEGYAMEIAWAQENGIKSANHAPRAAVTYSNVSPLISSNWGQNKPFNNKCIFNKKRCVTGCVPTAMAQVLAYWAIKGVGGKTKKVGCLKLPGYTTNTKKYKVPELAKVKFDWTNMKTYKVGTTAQKNAVAQLMRYCGQSVQADYRPDGTGANVKKAMQALQVYFNYNQSMNYIFNDKTLGLDNTKFKEAIFKEIKAKRPVIMAGYKNNKYEGGHAFICDGYKKDADKFHFNWGWTGSCNGYFKLTALKNVGGYNFNYRKEAIIGINPLDANRAYIQTSKDKKTVTFYYDTKKGTREGSASLIWPVDCNPNMLKGKDNVTKVVFSKSFANARPLSTAGWFNGYKSLTTISGIQNLNTSKVTNMNEMFRGCEKLKSLDLSKFNTANVADMQLVFYGCKSLTNLNISSFKTSKVERMRYMFGYCQSLTNLNVSSFNTSNVTDMIYMFYGCKNLSTLNLSKFNVAKVEDMTSMCSYSGIKSINLPSNLKKIHEKMFYGCSNLTSIVIPASVTSIQSEAFNNTSKLTSVTVGFSKPMTIASTTFSNSKNSVLYVPKGSRKSFVNAQYWKLFKSIVEVGSSNANENEMDNPEESTDDLDEIVTGSEKAPMYTIYTINGQFVGKRPTTTGLPAGLYIINGKKVVIR